MTSIARIVGGVPLTLADLERQIWSTLTRAAAQRRHDWSQPTFVTAGVEGPQARMVVLRDVDVAARRLTLYTDSRATKVAAVRSEPRVSWLFWDHASKTQVRMAAIARVAPASAARAAFELLPVHQWRDYLSRTPPGSPWSFEANRPHDGEPTQYFCVIETTVHTIDWLKLDRDVHNRARFDYSAGGTIATWITP
ncbi:MAG TPA: pyridoxamine 5'-phosphate oxidase family protein [Burkholderiaceae bacterium]|nr:pyridoxamine 5'-phosphate oxidase family protein [Burkholderiaceae bacterium]